MKKLLLLLIIPCITICQTSKKVLLIGMDGCRADALYAAYTPNIDNLINNSIYSFDALNNDITISGPGWSAILCGVWSDKHLVTDNSFTNNNYFNFPPIFKYINDFNPDFQTVSICNWGPINDYIVQDFADYKLTVDSDSEVSSEACLSLSKNNPDFIFLHFDEIDGAGHTYGFSPDIPEYIAAIEDVDNHIGPIIETIINRPDYINEDWLILLTTDHGGLNTSHGGNSIQEKNVFVIASNNNLSSNSIQKDSTYVSESVYNCLEDTIELQFDGVDDFVEIPNNSEFNFGSNQDFTIECRIKTSTAGDFAILGNKDWESGYNKGFVFSFKYPSGPEWKVNIGDGNNRVDINTGGSVADNEWHTLSVTFDRDGFMKMYEDGLLLDSLSIIEIGDITTNFGLFFGADINQDFDYIGSISEVRVWNSIINDEEIESWHCSHIEPSHPNYNNLIGYWKLNEDTGNTAFDSPGGFGIPNGTINNANWYIPDSTWVYDYSNTPRLTDVPVTALNHLCIPIDENWLLDGESLLSDCSETSIEEIFNKKSLIQTIDVLGRETNTNKGFQLHVYDDGSVEKKYVIK